MQNEKLFFSASMLWSFWKNPYKYKYEVKDLPQDVMYLWTLAHLAATWQSLDNVEVLLNRYCELFQIDLVWKEKINKMVESLKKYYDNNNHKYLLCESELKDIWKVQGYDVFISSTPDIIMRDDDWYLKVTDIKTANWFSWYEDERLWEEEMQPYVYPYLAMKAFKEDKCKFTYIVVNKNNGIIREFNQFFSKDYVEKHIQKVINEYIYCMEFDDWYRKWTRVSYFKGGIKPPPEAMPKVEIEEDNEDFF